MKNINTAKVAPLYEGQTIPENRAKIQATAEAATFCLLLIYNERGEIINAAADAEAVKSYAYTLRAAKLTKNGTRWRYCFTDYENGAEVTRATFPNCGTFYEYRLQIV